MKLRINSAHVLALVAIVLAAGGNAVAFTLGKNSVGSRQLKRSSVNSVKVKNRSLRAVDFRRGQLPAGRPGKEGSPGPQGEQGDRGPAGAPGATNVVVRHGNPVEAQGGSSAISHVECHDNEAVTGGGYTVLSQARPFRVEMNTPSAMLGEGITATLGPAPNGSAAIGWLVTIENQDTEPMTFLSYVLCASP